MCVCLCVCVCEHVGKRVGVSECVFLYVRMCVRAVQERECVCGYLCMSFCVCVGMCVHLFVGVCVCACMFVLYVYM